MSILTRFCCQRQSQNHQKIPRFSPFRRKQGILSCLAVMEYLVLGEEHGSAHGQSRQLGGGDGQPDAVDAQQQRQQENGNYLKRQRAQKEISALVTPSPSAVKKEDAYTLKPMMRKLSAYSRKARLVRASNSAS